jgi:hypothetical protein
MKSLAIALLAVPLFAVAQDKPTEPSTAPTFTLEPMKQWVPHCPAGTEPWYEPAGSGCPDWRMGGGMGYRDYPMNAEPIKPSEVECRPVGSKPKKEHPSACPV